MFLRLEAALALLKAAVKAPPLAGRGCAEADGSDVEEQEEPDDLEVVKKKTSFLSELKLGMLGQGTWSGNILH